MDEIVKIDLFGEEFRFKPDEKVKNPDRVAQDLEAYIDQAQDLVKNKSGARNKLIILLLAAMNLSRDYHELKLQHTQLEKDVEKKISSLIYKIEKGLDKQKP
ncbi:cell division protein ZapA [Desulfospira joergensenii]|uniref:cell division protein ZapA n=1 Tax=Desulfospira joergensenii TaxID=53329 RepID=UPI0003B4188B|nr:cell division protein ZapA [Desulfospira joergensenii]